MSALSVQRMTGLLTEPYRRGGETLEVPLGPDAAGVTAVPPYTFKEYRARHGSDPADPKYVLYLKVDAPAGGVDVTATYDVATVQKTATVKVPGGSFAGSSFAIPIEDPPSPGLRLVQLEQSPAGLLGAGRDAFGIVALLGNIAKLSWVVGWEKDQVQAHLRDVSRQRLVAFAHGASLDAIGSDLRVQRFPARPYTFDPHTLALYHLDDVVAGNGPIRDDTVSFGLPGHPGVNEDGATGVSGKFGNGLRVPGPAGAGSFRVASAPDFDLPANRDATLELLASVAAQPGPSLLIGKGAVNAAGDLTAPGWTLMIGTFRGIANNARFAASDGANTFAVFADGDLADGLFHHFACVLDRATQRAVLVVDGSVRSAVRIQAVGALTNGEPIRVGRSAVGHQLTGVIDEVRLSRVARQELSPVLGEGDASYRRRLGIFRRWLLPNPVELLRTINRLIQIDGQPDSFVMIEKNRAGASATAVVGIAPAALVPGQCITADGDTLASEASVTGTIAEDPDFREFYLVRHDSAAVNYLGGEDSRRMQVAATRALDELLRRLTGVAGRLELRTAFVPGAADLHGIGRVLLFTHESLALNTLVAETHRAGFDFVRHEGTAIHASVAAGEKLDIVIEPRPPAEVPANGSDLFVGNAIDLRLAQTALPASGTFRWTVIACGAGRVTVLPHPGDPGALRTPVEMRPRLRLRAEAPGEITVRVENTIERRTVTGTRTLRITVASLANGETIAADGRRAVSEEEAVGAPETAINPDYLIASTLAINFGADPNNRRMQLAVERGLVRLTQLLTAAGFAANTLEVLKAFDPAGNPMHRVGRAVRLQHPAANAGVLSALAHQTGFGFVRRDAGVVHASMPGGALIEIARSDVTPLGELTVGVPVDITARFSTIPAAGTFNWSTERIGHGRGSFDFVLRPQVRFTPTHAGSLALNVSYFEQDPTGVLPYTFEVALKPALDVPTTIVLKEQYDLLMNILNYFHPLGVEVLTRRIREHVVEVRENLLDAFPGYTYPDFRL